MQENKIKTLVWAGWFPYDDKDARGIFVKKHIQIISDFADQHVFSIRHTRSFFRFSKIIRNESFGTVHLYYVPTFLPLRSLGYLIIPLLEYRYARKKFKTIQYFHLHVSYPYALFSLPLLWFRIPRRILTEHCSVFSHYYFSKFPLLTAFFIRISARSARSFDAISAVSTTFARDMKRFFPPDKIRILHNVIHFPSNEYLHKEPDQEYFDFLSIGNLLDEQKNISFLLRVWSEVVKKNSRVRLFLYGDGRDREKLVARARELQLLDKYVFFMGSFKNEYVSHIYLKHHAFILLSNYETFSIATAEALSHGLPVIVTRCGAPEDYVEEGKNGYLTEINNVDMAVEKILLLIQNYDSFRRTDIIQNIKLKYGPVRILEQCKALYGLTENKSEHE